MTTDKVALSITKEFKMTKKSLAEMNYDEFQILIDQFIERSSQQTDEMSASIFFGLLFEQLTDSAEHRGEVTGSTIDKKCAIAKPNTK